MRVVVQRCHGAAVRVAGQVVGAVPGTGLVLLVGVARDDTEADLSYMVDKVIHLRVFPDEAGQMNLDVLQAGGDILCVSQFTLYGDARKGRRPNFMNAANADVAAPLMEAFTARLRQTGLRVETGIFGAMMAVSLVNDGPVTVLLDSRRQF